MKKQTKVILTIVACLVGIYFITHIGGYIEAWRATKNARVEVSAAKVIQKDVTVKLQVIGNVTAYNTVGVKSQVDGQLIKVAFTEGDFVKQGQLLFQIDPRPFQAALAQAQATLAKDQANLNIANLAMQRNSKLLKGNYISAQDFDQLKANVAAAQGTVDADQAAVTAAQVNLDYTSISSPISGRTGNLLVDEGNLIKTASATNLVTINQINPIYVNFSVPQQYFENLIDLQSKGPITLNIVLDNNVQENGQVTFIDNTIDTTTGTLLVKGTFANADERLWPGQFVTVNLPTTVLKNALVVPTQAVQTGQDGSYVYLVNKDDTVTYRVVKSGPQVAEGTVIVQGLNVGDQVITDGVSQLADGSAVKVVKR